MEKPAGHPQVPTAKVGVLIVNLGTPERADALVDAMGEPGRNPAQPQFTDHCFTGDYPTPLTDLSVATPRRLSLLAEAD